MIWLVIGLVALAIIIFLFVFLMKRNTIKNNSPFPINLLTLVNMSGQTLTSVDLCDSLGNDYSVDMSMNWINKASITVALPMIPCYGSIQLTATAMDDTSIVMYLVNNNGQALLVPVLDTDINAIQFKYGGKPTYFPLHMYDNTTYQVDGNLIQSGDAFPHKVYFYNNTSISGVVSNTNDIDGSDPSLDVLTLTSFYVTDSESNTYVDINLDDIPLSFKPNTKSNKVSIGSRPILIELENPITDGQSLQFYIETATTNYTMVLYNTNGTVITIYPPNLDPTAISLFSLSSKSSRVLCKPLKSQNPRNTAVFTTSLLWQKDQLGTPITDGSLGTLKVGFMGGESWQWAWTALVISTSIAPYANIDFDFVFPTVNTPLDASYHIRIGFDPKGGASSAVGNDSITFPFTKPTMNLGWMDAPLSGTFMYKNMSYTPNVAKYNSNQYDSSGSTIIHEFGHALGMQHEHQNPFGIPFNWNKPAVYRDCKMSQGWSEEECNLNVLGLLQKETINGSYFDQDSIMRYPYSPDLLIDGQNYMPWISFNPYQLSDCDKYWIQKNYPGRNVITSCNLVPITAANPIIISNQPVVNCVVTEWSAWSACSTTCGGGTQTSTRSITTAASNGGTACPALSQMKPCNSQACGYTDQLIPFKQIALRQQWLTNYGYCGETSFIASALYYGMYMSQYDVRRLTSMSNTQSKQTDQVLPGENSEVAAAKLFGFTYEKWSTSSLYTTGTADPTTLNTNFISWVNGHTSSGHPIVSVVYENADLAVNRTGSKEYDHIVSIVDSTLASITLCDNGIVDATGMQMDSAILPTPSQPPYFFQYTYPSPVVRNRTDSLAMLGGNNPYSFYSIPSGERFGIALTGINSSEPNLVRMQILTTDQEPETQPVVALTEARPTPVPINLTLRFYGVDTTLTYNLYRYKDPMMVPTSNYNSFYTTNSSNPNVIVEEAAFKPSSSPYTLPRTIQIQSNEIAIYRCVPVTAM